MSDINKLREEIEKFNDAMERINQEVDNIDIIINGKTTPCPKCGIVVRGICGLKDCARK